MIKKALKKVYNFFKRIKYEIDLNKILGEIDLNSDVILFGSPLHGNIGDHAISIAEVELLKKSGKKVIEIPGVYYNLFTEKIVCQVKKNDTIVITGGGFLGTLWQNEEDMVRSIISNFKDNKIIIMPQTIYYEDSKQGKDELKKAKQIYNSHKNLHIYLREENSYNFCKREFNKVKSINLVPDIVTYLNCQEPSFNRNGALFCLRKDKEKILNADVIENLEKFFINNHINIRYTTTVINKNISLSRRNHVFENKLKEFKTSNIVITDRLHGMIFSAITATPCIAFNNLTGKVKGVFKWLENLNYITVVDESNISNVLDLVEEKLNLRNNTYDNMEIKENLEKILENI